MSVKNLRDPSARLHKLQRSGALGNLKMARKGEHAPRKYASGGAVDAPPISGAPSRPRLDRPSRKSGKGKEAKTNINIVVAAKPDAKPPMPMPPPGGPPPGASPMPPPGPMGPGGPPPGMPPMNTGGSVGFARGGKVKKRADGGSVDAEQLTTLREKTGPNPTAGEVSSASAQGGPTLKDKIKGTISDTSQKVFGTAPGDALRALGRKIK